MPHLFLLGDSIFDNAVYTNGGPDVIWQVREQLPSGWKATLSAIDGSTTQTIPDQVQRLPNDATHLVLSVGGNDALTAASRLGISPLGPQETPNAVSLESLANISDDFEQGYRAATDRCLQPGLPLAVCTIYNGCFPDRLYQRIAAVALAIFNDVILRVAIDRRLPVIDLRQICTEPRDYANPIEPSSIGGDKIARAIVALVTGPASFAPGTRIFGHS